MNVPSSPGGSRRCLVRLLRRARTGRSDSGLWETKTDLVESGTVGPGRTGPLENVTGLPTGPGTVGSQSMVPEGPTRTRGELPRKTPKVTSESLRGGSWSTCLTPGRDHFVPPSIGGGVQGLPTEFHSSLCLLYSPVIPTLNLYVDFVPRPWSPTRVRQRQNESTLLYPWSTPCHSVSLMTMVRGSSSGREGTRRDLV